MTTTPIDASTVSEAVVVWTGWRATVLPARDERRLVDHYGPELMPALLTIVRSLEREFFQSEAYATATDLAQMGEAAARTFRQRHPELSVAAVEALAWCYTYDWK